MEKRTFKQQMLIDAPLLLYFFGMRDSGYSFVRWKSLLPPGIQQRILYGGIWTVMAIAVYYTCLFIHFYHKKDDPIRKGMLVSIPLAQLAIAVLFYITYFTTYFTAPY